MVFFNCERCGASLRRLDMRSVYLLMYKTTQLPCTECGARYVFAGYIYAVLMLAVLFVSSICAVKLNVNDYVGVGALFASFYLICALSPLRYST